MKRKSLFRSVFISMFALWALYMAPAANARSGGISGYSGSKGVAVNCNQCHGGGVAPVVTLTGPTTVVSGSTNAYTLTVSGGQTTIGGLDVAATAGTLTATDPLTKILSSELTHTSPKAVNASGAASWSFNWTAPTVTATTSVTMYGAGLSADNDGGTSGDASSNLSLAITVTAPAPAPTLTTTPASLSFAYTIGGTAPAAQSVAVSSSGSALSYTVASSATWLSAGAANGTTPGSISVSVNPTGLAAGTYTGSVTITSSGASNSPKTVPVTFVVSPAPVLPTITATPASLSFAFTIGGTAPAAQSVAVSSSGAAVSYSVSTSATWLVATANGTTPGTITVSMNPTGLAAGTYSGNVTITSSGASNSPRTVPVTFVVSPAPVLPTVSATPASLSFAFTIGGAAPAAQSVAVSSSGTAVKYTVTTSTAWLVPGSASGTTPGSVSISVNPNGLAAGTYNGNVTITSAGASNSPKTVPVTFVVSPAAVLPTITATPASLSFAFTIGGTAPAAQSVAVSSSGSALSYTVASSATWLSAGAASGTTPGSVSISVNPAGLAAGTYNGNVTITSAGASNSPKTVPVTIVVSPAAVLPTITATPASLSFAFTIGGTAPAAQSVAVSSSGAAVSYTVASSATWLSAGTASGTTPGSVSISVNPNGLAAGTYNGNVTVTSAGASNSPRTVPVTFVVSPAQAPAATITASPKSLAFAYQAGSSTPGSQAISITSSGATLSYTTASSAAWLSVSPASGTTPGSPNVSVNPAGLAAGTYNGTVTITAANASNSPQAVSVTLVVTAAPPTTTGSLTATPATMSFRYSGEDGGSGSGAQTISVTSGGKPVSFTTAVSGGAWLAVTPTSGTTPGTVSVSANTSGMAVGTYTGTITISAPGMTSSTVAVTLVAGSGEGDDHARLQARPYVSDPTRSGSVAASWVNGAGVPTTDKSDPNKQGLLLSKNSTTATKASAGATITGVQGMSISELGFDVRDGGHCTAKSPRFVITTDDNVVHTIIGCAKGVPATPAPALGWKRLRFDVTNAAQVNPPMFQSSIVKSMRVVLDDGPDSTTGNSGGVVVLDNIDVNGKLIGHGVTYQQQHD